MPYIFRHHARRLGVCGLGLLLLVGVGCKSPSGASSSWKMPGASLFQKQPAAAEASASDAPGEGPAVVAPPLPAQSAAETRALLFGEKAANPVMLASAVESEPTVRGQSPSDAKPAPIPTRGVTVIGAHASVAAAPSVPSEEIAAAPAPTHRSLWVDPWTESAEMFEAAPIEPSEGLDRDAATARPGAARLEPSPSGSSRRGREGEVPAEVASPEPASRPTPADANESRRVKDWSAVAASSVRPEPTPAGLVTPAGVPTPAPTPRIAMAAPARRPGFEPLEPSPAFAPPAAATIAPAEAPVQPSPAPAAQVAALAPITPAEIGPAEPTPALTSKAAALLRPAECQPAAPAIADPASELVTRSRQNLAAVRNYEARLMWRHSGDGSRDAKTGRSVRLTCRTQPRAIHAEFAAETDSKKWLYTEASGEPSLTQAESTSLGRVVMNVRPTDSQALAVHRRPINEWGLESLLEEIDQAIRLRDAGAANVSYTGRVWREDCQADLEQVVVTFPGRPGRIEYYFDPKTTLPVMVVSRDSRGGVREFERYADLKLNVGALDSPLAFDADAVLRR